MASGSVGERQLKRIIKDLHDAVEELNKEQKECGEPITDDSPNLHKFSYKLEYLLQFDQKEKTTFLGHRKDYWDYLCDCLAKTRGANDGIRFVKSIPELKTSLGKGRALVRYSLVHKRLADTLQQCLINQRITSDWYYARSPLLKAHLAADIINHLYELNEIHFDVAARGHDLDADWPTFARRTLGVNSAAHLWRAPSRCSSMNSLVSGYSQQAQDFLPGPDFGHSLLGDLGELGEPPPGVGAGDQLRLQLDQSELRQRELLESVRALGDEAAGLRGVVRDLQGQLLASQTAAAARQGKEPITEPEEGVEPRAGGEESRQSDGADPPDDPDGAPREESRQTPACCRNAAARERRELLDKLAAAEQERLEAAREAERLAGELGGAEARLVALEAREREERDATLRRAEELRGAVGCIQGALALKEEESGGLRAQLQALQASLEARERQAEELKRRLQEEALLQQVNPGGGGVGHKGALESQFRALKEQLEERSDRVRQLEEENRALCSSVPGSEASAAAAAAQDQHARTVEEYRSQCASLMELNATLLQTVRRSEESARELMEAKLDLQDRLAAFGAPEKDLRAGPEERESRGPEESAQTAPPHGGGGGGAQVLPKKREQENEDPTEAKEKQLAKASEPEEVRRVSEKEQAELREKLEEAETRLRERTRKCELLQARVDELEGAEREKGAAESPCSQEPPREGNQRPGEGQEGARPQLLAEAEERARARALQELTSASREDLCVQEEEEELGRDAAAAAAGEELRALRRRYDELAREHGEAREALCRAHTETAELGVDVCRLTAEKEETRLLWEEAAGRLGELEVGVDELRRENRRLRQRGAGPPGAERGRGQEEEQQHALRFQLSSQSMEHQKQLQVVNKELQEVRSQLEGQQEMVVVMETRVKQLESENHSYAQEMEEKNAQLATSHDVIRRGEEERLLLKENLTRSQEGVAEARRAADQLRESLRLAALDQQSSTLRTSAELDDLHRTKVNLEERLIELIREKDALWQKSDALEFEQKLRDEDTERDVNHCLGCHSQFSWWLRKHNCRLCGRAFCYYCCSNAVSTQQGGARERCCRDCYGQHSAVTERHPAEEPGTAATHAPFRPLPQPGRTGPGVAPEAEQAQLDDGVYDIITEEEVNGVYDSDSLSFSTACSPGPGQQGAAELNSSASAGDTASEDAEDGSASVQDAEICLLRAGELTLSVPFSLADLVAFGDSSRELFIKSSCYSIIPIAVGTPGPTVSWMFTSEPKSISFSVVYREDTHTPLEQARVLIPLTRCNSHKETIQGELKVRNPGEYTLIFDNSFSRNSSASAGDTASEDAEDGSASVQDAEICLLRAGELTLSVPFSLADLVAFGDSSRELFIKSSCYSIIPIAVGTPGPTVSWMFTSEPKSISFSVVYREDTHTPLEQARVLIPLTRCNSHKETIQGELKVRNPGEYTLIFDNSFSRFISKKVLYRLSVEEPVIYDGSDCV